MLCGAKKELCFINNSETILPKIDYVFNHILNDKVILRNFVCAMIKINEKNVEDIQYVDIYTSEEYEEPIHISTNVRMWIKNENSTIEEVHVEIQLVNFNHEEVLIENNYDEVLEQVKEAYEYGKLNKYIMINIFDVDVLDKKKYPCCYNIKYLTENIEQNLYNIEIHNIELKKLHYNNFLDSNILMWLNFLNSENLIDLKLNISENKILNMAYESLLSLESNQLSHQIYNVRKRIIKSVIDGIEIVVDDETIQKELQIKVEFATKIAKDLKNMGIDFKIIKMAMDL